MVIPWGVEVDTDPETTVVVGQPPRVQVTEEEAEAAEGAEGEAPSEAAPSAEGAPAATAESESPAEG
jgi:hypothetical protein